MIWIDIDRYIYDNTGDEILMMGIPVVPARGGAEVALGIYKTFLIYRTCMRRAPAKPVRACILRKLFPVSHVTFEAPLRTSHYSLHFFTLHTPHYTLHTPHFTLHTALFALHTSLHTALLKLHASHSTLHTSQSTLHISHFSLLSSHSTLHTALFIASQHFTPDGTAHLCSSRALILKCHLSFTWITFTKSYLVGMWAEPGAPMCDALCKRIDAVLLSKTSWIDVATSTCCNATVSLQTSLLQRFQLLLTLHTPHLRHCCTSFQLNSFTAGGHGSISFHVRGHTSATDLLGEDHASLSAAQPFSSHLQLVSTHLGTSASSMATGLRHRCIYRHERFLEGFWFYCTAVRKARPISHFVQSKGQLAKSTYL